MAAVGQTCLCERSILDVVSPRFRLCFGLEADYEMSGIGLHPLGAARNNGRLKAAHGKPID